MVSTHRVILCGKSLLFSGLKATLEATPGIDFQVVDPCLESIREVVIKWQPEVLILESELLHSAFSLSLMKNFPQLKLVGVDYGDNHLLVYFSHFSENPTTSDLLQVIEG
jgi:hypothetical protein